MKKILIMLIAVCVFAAAMPTVSAAELMNADFSKYSVGAFDPQTAGFIRNDADINSNAFSIENGADGNWLKVKAIGSTPLIGISGVNFKQKIYLKFRIQDNGGNTTCAIRGDGVATNVVYLLRMEGGVMTSGNDDAKKTIINYTFGQWYDITILFDGEAATYKLSVDGVEKLSDTFPTGSDANKQITDSILGGQQTVIRFQSRLISGYTSQYMGLKSVYMTTMDSGLLMTQSEVSRKNGVFDGRYSFLNTSSDAQNIVMAILVYDRRDILKDMRFISETALGMSEQSFHASQSVEANDVISIMFWDSPEAMNVLFPMKTY